MERKRQRIGLLGRISIGLLGLAVERERQRISLLGRIDLLGLAVERKRQRRARRGGMAFVKGKGCERETKGMV